MMMTQKNIITFIFSIMVLFSLNSLAFADSSKLVGNWKGSKVKLNLKANNTYTYNLKGLKFNGTWSASGKTLTLKYKMMGVKKSRKSTYSFKGTDLVLSSKKGNVVLKRQ